MSNVLLLTTNGVNNYAIRNEYKLYQTEVNMNVSNGNAQFNDMYLLYKNGTKLNFITSKYKEPTHRIIKEHIISDTKKFIDFIDSNYVKKAVMMIFRLIAKSFITTKF